MAIGVSCSTPEKSTSFTSGPYFLLHRCWIILIVFACIHGTSGGICWYTITKSKLCKTPYKYNITKSECCKNRSPGMSWTPDTNLTSGNVFFIKYLRKGASQCQPCHDSCKEVKCPKQKHCKMKKRRPKCVCRQKCTRDLRKTGKLCGNDGKTYRNHCHMIRRNCKKKSDVKPSYKGRCKQSCRKVQCLDGKHCLEDQNGLPHCVHCRKTCPQESNTTQLCGEDGVTYTSLCHLRLAVCKNGRAIKIAYTGACRANASCSTVCPRNMKCLMNPNTGQPQCEDCDRKCSPFSLKYRVCGTDGVTYASYCALRKASCDMGIPISTKRFGCCDRARHCRTHRKFRRKRKRTRKRHKKHKVQIKIKMDEVYPVIPSLVQTTIYSSDSKQHVNRN